MIELVLPLGVIVGFTFGYTVADFIAWKWFEVPTILSGWWEEWGDR